MMARKLSQIASRPAFLTIAGIASLAANSLLAQSEIQIAAPANVVENPFLSAQPEARTVSEEPQTSHRPTITYQNPFAGMSKLPPVDTSLRPGPISRWQHPTIPDGESSPIKSAMLSGQSGDPFRPRWDELPAAENLRHCAAAHASESDLEFYSRLSVPPDTIRLSPKPLTQPTWLTADTDETISGQWSSRAVDPAVFDAPLDASEFAEQMAALSPDPGAAFSDHVAGASANDTLNPFVAKANVPPAIISACVDTPAGWLEQAQHAAPKASSPEDLSAIIESCDHGLRGEPDAKLSSSLRRLAAWAHNRRGELLAEAGRIDEAHNDFQVAISLDPHCSLAIHNRAVTLAQQNEFAAALRDFNRVIELNPGLAVAYRNRAELLAALGRMDDAAADFSQAIESLPNDAELYRGRAYANQRRGNFHKALADLNRAIEIAPDEPESYTQRGNLAAETGNFDKAIADFRRALAIEPKCADAYRSLAWLQATCPNPQFQNPQQAIAAAKQAAKLSPADDSLILDTLAAAQASSGQFDQAIEIQQKAIASAPPELAQSLEQRLALYRHGRAFRSVSSPNAARTVSHEEPSGQSAPPASRNRSR